MLSATWVTLESSLAGQTAPSLLLAPGHRGLIATTCSLGTPAPASSVSRTVARLATAQGRWATFSERTGPRWLTALESTWTNNGFFYVGGEQGGNGVLNIANGGHVNSNGSFAYIGYGTNSQSSATIDGANSLWNNFRGLYIGFDGQGTLSITNGGRMTNGTFANVGFSVGATGTLNVSGADSIFSTGGALSIGGNAGGPGGTGLLDIDNGGTVSAASLNIWEPGTLTGTGSITNSTTTMMQGTLAPEQTILIAGTVTFGATASTVVTVTPAGGGNVAVQGSVTLAGQLGVTFSGGPFTPGTQYTLLQAGGGLNGTTFSSVSIDFPPGQGFTPHVTYDADHVYLYLEPIGTPTPTPTSSPTPTPNTNT